MANKEIEGNNNGNGEISIAGIEDILQELTESDRETIKLSNGMGVIVRPLNRKEALRFKGNRKMPRDVFEQRIVSIAMVEPRMTQAQISQWQEIDRADGDLKKITDTIVRISGMAEEGPKRD